MRRRRDADESSDAASGVVGGGVRDACGVFLMRAHGGSRHAEGVSSGPTASERTAAPAVVTVRAWRELALIAFLYVGYSASRTLASDDRGAALVRARDLLHLEGDWRIDVEQWLNRLFVQVDWLGVVASYWYATTHYLVTLAVLVWLFRRSRAQYLSARRALVLASLLGLACYLAFPTAPPRFVEGFTDVLALHSEVGWWGSDASAPKGFGHLTNELAAFPSLHAGWALWVAVVVSRSGVRRGWHVLAWAYAVAMGIVVIGTGNHWTLDVVGGWAVVAVGFLVVDIVQTWSVRRPEPEGTACPDALPDTPRVDASDHVVRRREEPDEPRS